MSGQRTRAQLAVFWKRHQIPTSAVSSGVVMVLTLASVSDLAKSKSGTSKKIPNYEACLAMRLALA